MAKYYKGNIIKVNSFNESIYKLNIVIIGNKNKKGYVLEDSSKKAYLYFKKYSAEKLEEITNDLLKLTTVDGTIEKKMEYDDLFKDAFKMNADNVLGTNIIYEKIYDEDGNSYGKELITGDIFPINSKYSDYNISYESDSKKVFLDKETGMSYVLDNTLFNLADWSVIDAHGEKYKITDTERFNLNTAIYAEDEHSVFINNRYIILRPVYPKCFLIKITPRMTFPANQRIEYTIAGEEIANELEVNNYVNKLESGFGKRKRKKEFINEIRKMNLSNYLGDNIVFVKNGVVKERIKEETITKEMEELEFLLLKLKGVSEEEYNKINDEYNDTLSHDKTDELSLNPLTIKTIITLQNKANLAYICHGGNSKKILEYLEEKISIYLNNYVNGSKDKTELSISDLDKITENFLSSKNSYSYKEQNEILRNIALLYFFEIYENINVLTSNDLVNSYVMDNIKRIIIVIGVLKDEGIISNVSNMIYDITNIDELLEVIKKIEFSDSIKEEVNNKELIKRIQR